MSSNFWQILGVEFFISSQTEYVSTYTISLKKTPRKRINFKDALLNETSVERNSFDKKF